MEAILRETRLALIFASVGYYNLHKCLKSMGFMEVDLNFLFYVFCER